MMDPVYKLLNYACDKFYIVEHEKSEKPFMGLLLNCSTSRYWFLTEQGLYMVKIKDLICMKPISMPEHLNHDFKALIEKYLEERTIYVCGKQSIHPR